VAIPSAIGVESGMGRIALLAFCISGGAVALRASACVAALVISVLDDPHRRTAVPAVALARLGFRLFHVLAFR
jgi:hypothetical protein